MNTKVIEEFWYNGLNHRISWVYDTNSNGEASTAGGDAKFHLAHDERWRIMALYREDDDTPKEQFVYHTAGADGSGASSYIDAVILRDKDASSRLHVASDDVLEQRRYYCQNWRADVIAMLTESGAQAETYRYSAYGVPFGMFAGDVNGDGLVDATDTTQIQTWINGSAYDVRGDLDRDNDVDLTDKSTATANIGKNLGW